MLLYVSIPFCPHVCTYCCWTNQFSNEDRFNKRTRKSYTENLCKSIELFDAPKEQEVVAALFGGGTPTLLPGDQLNQIMVKLHSKLKFTETAQVTIETTPRAILQQNISGLRDTGFNRISFGVETFDDTLLSLLGRKETAADAFRAIRLAKEQGFTEVNVDLMFSYPGSTLQRSLEDVRLAIKEKVEHISLYPYFPAEGTRLYQDLLSTKETIQKGKLTFEVYMRCKEELEKAGYREYIFSLFAKDGHECVYERDVFNWNGDLLGFGSGAHSVIGQSRNIVSHSAHQLDSRSDSHPLGLDPWMFPTLKMLRTPRGIHFNTIGARTGSSYASLLERCSPLKREHERLIAHAGVIMDSNGIRFINAEARAEYYTGLPSSLYPAWVNGK